MLLARLAWLFLLLISVSCFAADSAAREKGAKLVVQAQALVETGKFAEAYELLQPLEFDMSGDVTFDYLLGISAVNSSKPDRATLALERVEAVSPEYGDVRQWLGIAYFQSGDMERAKKAFTALLGQSKLSVESREMANQYLVSIKQQDEARELEEKKAKRPYLLGSVEFGLGRDNNLTSVPDEYARGFTASLAGFPLPSPVPSGISDRFSVLNGNIEARVPFANAGTYGYVSLDSANKAFSGNSMMNSFTNVVKGGVNLQAGRHAYRFDLSRRDYRQQGTSASQGITSNSTQNSAGGDARFTLGDRDYLGVSLQYNQPRFPTSDTQDTNQIALGANYTHIFHQAGSPMVYLALSHTRDKAVRASVPLSVAVSATDVSRNTNAFIAYAQYSVIESADITAMWMTSRRNDSKPFARSNVEPYGKDDMRVTMLGVNWRPAKDWTVKPQLMKINNLSNIPLYAFQKTELSITVKREFK